MCVCMWVFFCSSLYACMCVCVVHVPVCVFVFVYDYVRAIQKGMSA